MNRIFTVPNILTILRVFSVPIFLYLLIQENPRSRLIALLIFIVASITDFLDGYLARRLSMDSRFGRFLDPLADKFLVVSTIVTFYFLDKQIPLWMVLTIIGRDVLITLLRYFSLKKGRELKTSKTAKAKTAFQMISIVLILLIFFVRSYRLDIQKVFSEGYAQGKKNIEIATELFWEGVRLLPEKDVDKRQKKAVFAESVPYFIMLFVTIFTAFSGLRYFFYNYKALLPPYFPSKKLPPDKNGS